MSRKEEEEEDRERDGDIAIVREHSEWDLLRQRFENAAREGNVIDLTNESDEGETLDSEEAIASMPRNDPIEVQPSLIVPSEQETTTIQWTPEENQVRMAMGEVMAKILSLRELLHRSFTDSDVHITIHSVDDINAKVCELNCTIRSMTGRLRSLLRSSIENLGRLVQKANLLISDYNRLKEDTFVDSDNDDDDEEEVEQVINSTVSRRLRPREPEESRRNQIRSGLGLRPLKRRRRQGK